MNLHLKFHQNRVSNSWDIANIEFVWKIHSLYGEDPQLICVQTYFHVKPN